ncbi:MAG: alkane 1-monooxygenase [Saprospiraceae bacterium]|jgi:alkane 1-monooxygenase|nr:alkane 1-monooxygenase [Saprospiraceae bacterium]
MLRDAKYLIAYLLPTATYVAVLWQGIWSFSTLILAFGILPLLEQFLGGSPVNLTAEEETEKNASPFFDVLLYLNLPILYGLLWLYLDVVTDGGLAIWETAGLALSMGITVGSIGINVAHELGHRQSLHETLMAKVMLTAALYTHFNIEHNRGHHRWVATDEDPSSARPGESLYHFWFRSVTGTYLKAWHLENDRLRQIGKPVLSIHNEMIWFQIAHLAYLALVWWAFGWAGVGFAVLAAVLGFLLLETVNYIEHYGLRRKRMANGFYETVSPRHSWNSDHELGRIFLYELTRHSDHHYKATRKYQVLRHFDESPQLPHGYPATMLLALVPPLWFSVMDKRTEVGTATAA